MKLQSGFFDPPQATPMNAESRRLFIAGGVAIVLLAFILRIYPVFFWPMMDYSDEILESVEQGHRLVFGYGIIPIEFGGMHARSWLLGYLTAGLIKVSLLFGDGPGVYMPVVGCALAALSAATCLCAYRWGYRLYGLAGALVAGLVTATWIDLHFYGSRACLRSSREIFFSSRSI